jgi:hypothetical protein
MWVKNEKKCLFASALRFTTQVTFIQVFIYLKQAFKFLIHILCQNVFKNENLSPFKVSGIAFYIFEILVNCN